MGLLLCNTNFSLIGIFADIVSPPEPADPPLQRTSIFQKRVIILFNKVKISGIGLRKTLPGRMVFPNLPGFLQPGRFSFTCKSINNWEKTLPNKIDPPSFFIFIDQPFYRREGGWVFLVKCYFSQVFVAYNFVSKPDS